MATNGKFKIELEQEEDGRWIGEVPRWRARRILARSRLMILSSRMEGGANVISEAIVDGGCERGEPGGFDVERSHRRGDQLAAAGAHTPFSAQRLGHRDPTVCKGARSAPPAETLYPLSLG